MRQTDCGRRRRLSLPTAMSPPRASSQARVSGEKNALEGLVDVNTIENAYEATITVPSRIASRTRNEILVTRLAAIKNTVG